MSSPDHDRGSNNVVDWQRMPGRPGTLMDMAFPLLGDPGYFKERNSGMTLFEGVGVAYKH